MPILNQEVIIKPTDAISRREVGKVAWKSVLNELIDSEKDDLADLKALRRRSTDPESIRLISGLLERKIERVIELNLLLRYRDKEKERLLSEDEVSNGMAGHNGAEGGTG